MKHSKTNLVVLVLVALSASSYAQSAGRGVGQHSDDWARQDNRRDTSRHARPVRGYEVVIRELENSIRKLRCALPIYQGRRADAIRDTMQVLDLLREPDRSWPGNFYSQRDREDYQSLRQFRDLEIRQSQIELQDAFNSLTRAIEFIERTNSRNDRWSDRLVDGLQDARRDIKMALVQAERFQSHRGNDRRDDRRDDGNRRRG